MPSTIPVTCRSAEGKSYRVQVPARTMDEAIERATRLGHEVVGEQPSPTPATQSDYEPADGCYAAAMACSAAGLLFPPAAMAGIALGLLSRRGGPAIGIGLVGLVGWGIAALVFSGVLRT